MLHVLADNKEAGILDYNAVNKEFVFNYTQNNPISLTMPYTTKSYLSSYHLHPIFDMNMPEGYLFTLFKNMLIKKYGEIDDYILFTHLSRTIEGYLTYEGSLKQNSVSQMDLEDILHSKETDIFNKLVHLFLEQSAISGIQPKVLAHLEDKATLSSKAYIIKSFSVEYPHLAENEYFCMKAIRYAGIPVPKFWLSDNKQLFIMEKFNYKRSEDTFYGFEEFCVLFEKTKEKKYSGSYEQIAKAIASISTQKEEDLKIFYKMIIMSFLLKNGDAHLKNFGMLYEPGFSKRFLAPAYDVVNTCTYLPKDTPALTLFGNKTWASKKDLLTFGTTYCLLSTKEALSEFECCVEAVKRMRQELETYAEQNTEFKDFSKQFIAIIDFSLEENLSKAYKDISNGIL